MIVQQQTNGYNANKFAFTLEIPSEWVMLDSIDYDTRGHAVAYVKHRLVENRAAHFEEDAQYAVFPGKTDIFAYAGPANIRFNEDIAYMVARMYGFHSYLPLKKLYIEDAMAAMEDLGYSEDEYLIVKGKVNTLYLQDEALKTMVYLKVPECFYSGSSTLPESNQSGAVY